MKKGFLDNIDTEEYMKKINIVTICLETIK
jgi:hypothetical protein